MRPLAEELHAAGWAARGMPLPGFGPQLSTLGDVRWEDWMEAVLQELRALRGRYARVLLIGCSLGGSLALAASPRLPVLIVQGADDENCPSGIHTAPSAAFPRSPRYAEVPGEYALTRPTSPGWEEDRR